MLWSKSQWLTTNTNVDVDLLHTMPKRMRRQRCSHIACLFRLRLRWGRSSGADWANVRDADARCAYDTTNSDARCANMWGTVCEAMLNCLYMSPFRRCFHTSYVSKSKSGEFYAAMNWIEMGMYVDAHSKHIRFILSLVCARITQTVSSTNYNWSYNMCVESVFVCVEALKLCTWL